MTADRGLCGGFNTNICKLAKQHIRKLLSEKKQVKIITVGSKGHDQIKNEFGDYIIENLSFKDKKQITFKEANDIGKKIIDLFDKNQFDKCILYYNNFKNVITQIPRSEQIIPAPIKEKEITKEDRLGYEFEPDEDEILEDLLPKKYIHTNL